MSRASIKEHEGKKYLRTIRSATIPAFVCDVDVYCVLDAFVPKTSTEGGKVAIQHALKKLLMPGERGKGTLKADLLGAIAAINRAIDFEDQYQNEEQQRVDQINQEIIRNNH